MKAQIDRISHLIETIFIMRERSGGAKKSQSLSVVHDESLYK